MSAMPSKVGTLQSGKRVAGTPAADLLTWNRRETLGQRDARASGSFPDRVGERRRRNAAHPGRLSERPARRPRTDLSLMSSAVYALEKDSLCLTRQAPGELSAPDTECAGHNEPEARDPERRGPPADHRRPMGQHPCEMEQSDEREQSSGDH